MDVRRFLAGTCSKAKNRDCSNQGNRNRANRSFSIYQTLFAILFFFSFSTCSFFSRLSSRKRNFLCISKYRRMKWTWGVRSVDAIRYRWEWLKHAWNFKQMEAAEVLLPCSATGFDLFARIKHLRNGSARENTLCLLCTLCCFASFVIREVLIGRNLEKIKST